MEPKIGVGIFVRNADGQFVVGKRKGSHGAGTWAVPGGHLEFGESFENCAERELLEETGMQIENLRFLTAVNSVLEKEQKHYVTVFMGGTVEDGVQPQNLEPEKCEAWEWISWDQLRAHRDAQLNSGPGFAGRQLFLPILNLFEQRPDFKI